MSGPLPKPTPEPKATVCPRCSYTKRAHQGCLRCGWRPPAKARKAIARKTPIARGAGPRPVSAKRRPQLREYSATFRATIIARDGGCVVGKIEPEECRRIQALWWDVAPQDRGAVEVEHVNGRRGWRLLDEWGAVALHRCCHVHVTEHAKLWKPKLRRHLAALKGGGDGEGEAGDRGIAGLGVADSGGAADRLHDSAATTAAVGGVAAGQSTATEGSAPCSDSMKS